MKKVIIITRKGEYGSQNIFSNAISSMKSATKYSLSIIEKFAGHLAAKMWEDAKGNENDDERAAKLLDLDHEAYLKELEEGKGDPNVVMISELEKRLLNSMSSPYAYFITSEYEVILVLIDNLQIESSQAIPNFVEFMDYIKSDCNVEGNDNILYIHDTQLYGSTIDDVTIYQRENGLVKVDLISDKNSNFHLLKSSLSTYKFIAVFKHLPYKSSYFQSQILSMKFGQSNLLDELIKIEEEMDKMSAITEMQNNINNSVKQWKQNSSQ